MTQPESAPHSTPRRFRILIIEDNTADLLLFRYILYANDLDNVDLQGVKRGDEALELIQSIVDREAALPDLVILDLNLPVVDGFEILKHLRSQSLFDLVPVIVMSGSDRAEDREQAAELGASDYVVKTSNLEAMIALGIMIRRKLTL
jgi:CheY-like chemotaxis protein